MTVISRGTSSQSVIAVTSIADAIASIGVAASRLPERNTPMQRILILLCLLLATALPSAIPAAEIDPDKIAMETYYMAFLYPGDKWTPEVTPATEELQKAHLANIRRLSKEGKLVLAGPFLDDGELRGIFVFRVGSLEEARALCDTDPAVKARRLRVELHPWLSAKGITIVTEPAPADSARGPAKH
jgi:uncharacterized protein YciI